MKPCALRWLIGPLRQRMDFGERKRWRAVARRKLDWFLCICIPIRAIDKRRLKQYISTLSFTDLEKLNDSLRQVLALS